jgi:hypothetical protein
MATNFLDQIFSTMRDNLSDFPSTSCPTDTIIYQYVIELGGNTTISPEDRLHISECRKCFDMMLEIMSKRNTEEFEELCNSCT